MKTIYQKKIIWVLVWLLALIISACKKFVEIQPPSTQLATVSVFSSDAAATAAQLAIYAKMSSSNAESYAMAQNCGLLSDELSSRSNNSLLVQFYTNAMSATNSPGPWNNAYGYIFQANAIIANLQHNQSISGAVAKQLTGESEFIRAFWYFYLTNLYGDVPLVTTNDYTINGSISRSSQALVYGQIVADLKDASLNLNSNYVDVSDTAATVERVRPNKAAAEALLARVYLYTQKYDLAEAQATLVINNSLYQLCPNLSPASGNNYVFQKNSTEAILQMQSALPSTVVTYDASGFILKGAPGTGNNNSSTISPQLLNSFEANDKRRSEWIGTYATTSSPIVNYNYPYKYRALASGSITTTAGLPEYYMILRLAEQYLIRAEARVQQSNANGAILDLNVIRQRAGLPGYAGPTDAASLLTAILHERQVELFTEWGHRWLDLKRTGKADAVMGGSSGVTQAKKGTWDSHDQLFPIPQSERIIDANLTQNPGY